jgi:flagellar hook-associated protein 1 FlgK
MSLFGAASIAQSSLNALTAESAVVSRNIAGVNDTATTSRKIANVVTTADGGARVTSITRAQNNALFENVLNATASSAAQDALSAGLTQLNQTVGDTNSDHSPAVLLSDFTNSLQSYAASPTDSSLASAAVSAAQTLTSSLNNATSTVQQVRKQADADMQTSVTQINSLLAQFQKANTAVVQATVSGADATDALDARDTLLTQLSKEIGITTTTNANNDMSIYTDSGVTLFQASARTVSFAPMSAYSASTTGNAVYVDGVQVTGTSATMPISSGKLAGLATLRDKTTTTYQTQLDELARGLINAFAETNQSTSATVPGLFTYSGSPNMPAASGVTGLAADIKVNANVDPSQGGSPTLLRDGGIYDPTDPNYDYNTSGNASYTGRLQQLLNSVGQTQNFNTTGAIDPTDSLSGYASASVSWLQAQRKDVTAQSTYQATLLSQATSALSSSTGVNLDTEMSKMLNLEQSYSASAKLMSTINSMFNSLLSAMA